MKIKSRVQLILLLLLANHTFASPSCCCTGSGANWSILPNVQSHLMGVTYTYASLHATRPKSLDVSLSGQKSNEFLHRTNFFGRFQLSQRWQLIALVPYQFILSKTAGVSRSVNGIGDVSLFGQFNVLDPKLCDGNKVKQQLRLGAGLKLPVGKFRMSDQRTFYTGLQTGTGSLDILLSGIYTLRYKQGGLNLRATSSLNTPNKQAFRFGHRIEAGLQGFYIITLSKTSIMPTAGIDYEFNGHNHSQGRVLDYTGGDLIAANAGLDVYTGKIAFSLSAKPTLYQHLNWSGELKRSIQFEAGIFYCFK